MAKKQRHAYTEEFRREAVRRSDQPGNTATSVAKELGLHPGQIYNWRRQFSRLSEKQFIVNLPFFHVAPHSNRPAVDPGNALFDEPEYDREQACYGADLVQSRFCLQNNAVNSSA